MSTVSKTKPRDRKVINDSQKTPSKASGSMGASVVTGAYNPLLGTFQTIESLTATGSSLHNNGRFRNIDESDSTGADCDSVSNNGSWSGDSEDHKEKVSNTAVKQEIIPGADNEKREKMRLKNERKHQRQKEKRAQELHERCCQFLMSRKLEVLAQQLVAMGIAHERAIHALMLNDGKIEESINWLFDDGGATVADKKLDPASGNLKLDISQELGRILELETKYKSTKQDVERSVVFAEGDIEKAEESLRRQKLEQSSRKPEIVSDNNSVNSSKPPSAHTSQSTVAQLQPNLGMYPTGGEESVDRKNLGYSRGSSYISGESGNQNGNPMDRIHMKLQWIKLQQNAALEEQKRMPYQQTPMSRPTEETHYVAALGDQFKKLQHQEMREPVMSMQQQQQQLQRSQSANTNVLPVSNMNTSFTGAAATAAGNGWYPANRSEVAQSNGYLPTRTLPPSDLNSNLIYQQLQYQQFQGQVNSGHRMAGASAPPAVAPAASLGLFSGYGSMAPSGSSSGLDWNTDGSLGHLDYNNIDWSLDKGLACPRPSQQQYVASSPYETQMNGRTRTTANVNGISMPMGVQEAGLVGNGRDWTSPFEGKDLFSLSRQFVPPSL